MTDDEILHKVADIIRDVVDDDDVAITTATKAEDVPGWDSMSHINIIVATEMTFGIKLPTAALEEAKNVGDLINLIKEHLASK